MKHIRIFDIRIIRCILYSHVLDAPECDSGGGEDVHLAHVREELLQLGLLDLEGNVLE